jgi:hypothetical protein
MTIVITHLGSPEWIRDSIQMILPKLELASYGLMLIMQEAPAGDCNCNSNPGSDFQSCKSSFEQRGHQRSTQ